MPDFVNKNNHAIRTVDNDEKRVRVRPGQVVSATGKYADRLKSINGVETASEADKQNWDESRQSPLAGKQDARAAVSTALGELRAQASALVTAIDQVVIGDDQAPFGPSSGTITTKHAAGAEHPHAFGTNEAFQSGEVEGDVVTPGDFTGSGTIAGRDVHVTQHAKASQQDNAAQALVKHITGGASDEDDKPADDGDGDK